MSFYTLDLSSGSMDFLVNEIRGIPTDNNTLILTQYPNNHDINFESLFTGMPDSIKEIDVTQLDDCKTVAQIIKNLPPHVTKFTLNPASFRQQSTEKICQLLTMLSATQVSHLSIEGPGLAAGNKEAQEKIIKAIPPNINFLTVSNQNVTPANFLPFSVGLKSLPLHLINLDLSQNDFDNLSLEEFLVFLKNLPRHIRSLSLSTNGLNKFIAHMDKICGALPPLLELDVSSNEFQSTELPNFRNLRALQRIDLRGHCFELTMGYPELCDFFRQSLHETVTAVMLEAKVTDPNFSQLTNYTINPRDFTFEEYKNTSLVETKALQEELVETLPMPQDTRLTFEQFQGYVGRVFQEAHQRTRSKVDDKAPSHAPGSPYSF